MSRSSDGRLFHTVDPEMEKARLPSFVLVLTVTADLVVDDLSRLLTESDSVNVTRLLAVYAGQPW